MDGSEVLSCSVVSLTFVTPWTIGCRPLPMGFFQARKLEQFAISSGDPPDPEIEPATCVSYIGRKILHY